MTGSLVGSAVKNYRQLAIRIFTGAWCLVGFVLVTAYSSVLISFVTAPDPFKLILNSIGDLLTNHNIKLIVNKNLMADVTFMVY